MSRHTMIDHLLGHLADPTLCDEQGETVGQNNISTLIFSGMTALHHACKEGDTEAAKLLLRKATSIDIQDIFGWTALHYAIASLNESLVTLILDHRPDLHLLDFNNMSYLEHGLHKYKSQIFLQLFRALPRRHRREEKKETWLHFCAVKGYIHQAEMLLKEGFDINEPDALSQTPLHYAIRASEVNLKKIHF